MGGILSALFCDAKINEGLGLERSECMNISTFAELVYAIDDSIGEIDQLLIDSAVIENRLIESTLGMPGCMGLSNALTA